MIEEQKRKVTIKFPEREEISLHVPITKNIQFLKEEISKLKNIPTSKIAIYHRGKRLNDDVSIFSFGEEEIFFKFSFIDDIEMDKLNNIINVAKVVRKDPNEDSQNPKITNKKEEDFNNDEYSKNLPIEISKVFSSLNIDTFMLKGSLFKIKMTTSDILKFVLHSLYTYKLKNYQSILQNNAEEINDMKKNYQNEENINKIIIASNGDCKQAEKIINDLGKYNIDINLENVLDVQYTTNQKMLQEVSKQQINDLDLIGNFSYQIFKLSSMGYKDYLKNLNLLNKNNGNLEKVLDELNDKKEKKK